MSEWRDKASLFPWIGVQASEYIVDNKRAGMVRRCREGWRGTSTLGFRKSKTFKHLALAKGWVERNSQRPA